MTQQPIWLRGSTVDPRDGRNCTSNSTSFSPGACIGASREEPKKLYKNLPILEGLNSAVSAVVRASPEHGSSFLLQRPGSCLQVLIQAKDSLRGASTRVAFLLLTKNTWSKHASESRSQDLNPTASYGVYSENDCLLSHCLLL